MLLYVKEQLLVVHDENQQKRPTDHPTSNLEPQVFPQFCFIVERHKICMCLLFRFPLLLCFFDFLSGSILTAWLSGSVDLAPKFRRVPRLSVSGTHAIRSSARPAEANTLTVTSATSCVLRLKDICLKAGLKVLGYSGVHGEPIKPDE